MSKRFGRNQKRRARLALEAANAEAAILQSRLAGVNNTIANIKSAADLVREQFAYLIDILNVQHSNFAGLPPKVMVVGAELNRDLVRLRISPAMRVEPPSPDELIRPIADYHDVPLRKIMFEARRHQFDLTTIAHLCVKDRAGAGVSYHISDAALRIGIPPAQRREILDLAVREMLRAFEERTLSDHRAMYARRRV